MSEQLFRQQVIEARAGAAMAFGQPVARVNRNWDYFIVGLASFCMCLLVFLFFVKAPRQAVAMGYLKYSQAEASVYASTDGVIEQLHVKEGDFVTKGSALGDIVADKFSSSGGQVDEEIKQNLEREIGLLGEQQLGLKNTAQADVDALNVRHKGNETTIERLNNRLLRLTKQERLALERVNESKRYISDGLITLDVLNARQDAVEGLYSRRSELESVIQDLNAENDRTPYEKNKIEAAFLARLLQFKQQILQLETQIKNLEFKSSQRLIASKDGKVTAVRVREGEVVRQNDLMLVIVPQDSELYAEVFLPSSAIPFVEIGQEVRLSYAAFPAQKFGQSIGVIRNIASTAILSSELKAMTQEQVLLYRVEVTLEQQLIKAEAKQIALLAGMELNADIVLDNYSLLSWIVPSLRTFGLSTR